MTPRQQLATDLGGKITGCTVGLKFGRGALEVDSKVFAFTMRDESAAVKLPAARIAELLDDSEIRHLRMGERTMREWVVVPNIAAAPDNLRLLREATSYVASLPKTERRKPAKKAARKAAKKR
jgi:hypothetical protein